VAKKLAPPDELMTRKGHRFDASYMWMGKRTIGAPLQEIWRGQEIRTARRADDSQGTSFWSINNSSLSP